VDQSYCSPEENFLLGRNEWLKRYQQDLIGRERRLEGKLRERQGPTWLHHYATRYLDRTPILFEDYSPAEHPVNQLKVQAALRARRQDHNTYSWTGVLEDELDEWGAKLELKARNLDKWEEALTVRCTGTSLRDREILTNLCIADPSKPDPRDRRGHCIMEPICDDMHLHMFPIPGILCGPISSDYLPSVPRGLLY
jgi:hypothetical protein